MKIDGKIFKTYSLDNIHSIKRRYAFTYHKVIPEFIILKKIKSGDEKDILSVENEYESINIVSLMKKAQISDIGKIYELNEPSREEEKNGFKMNILDFAALWCSIKFDSKIPHFTNEGYFPLDEFLTQNNVNMNYLENHIPLYLKTLRKKIDNYKETINYETKILESFEKYEQSLTTKLEITKVKKQFVYKTKSDAFLFYDSIKLNDEVPFVVLRDFYKIQNEFRPIPKWVFVNDEFNYGTNKGKDILVLKVSNKKSQNINEKEKDSDYTTVILKFESAWEEYLSNKKEKELQEEKLKQKLKQIDIGMSSQKDKTNEEKPKIKRKGAVEKEKKEQNSDERKKEQKEKEEKVEFEKNLLILEKEENIKTLKTENKVYLYIENDINCEISEEELLQRVFSSFTINLELVSGGKETQIQSEFILPEQIIDFPIFQDMMFNNPILKQYFQLDERMSLQKIKKNLYFYFIPDPSETKQNYIACSLMQKKIEKTDTKIMSKDVANLKPGTPYLTIKIIRCNSKSDAFKFKEIFSRVVQIYKNTKDKIISEYKEFLPNINELLSKQREVKEQKRYVRTKELLKDIDPEKFIPGYARICQKKNAPKVLNEKEIEKYFGDNATEEDKNKQKHMMLYPKTEEEGNQFYYSCLENKQNNLYPGLQRNNLENFDKIPVVPCCFVSDQSAKLNSPYDLYYGNKNMDFNEMREYFLEKDESDEAKHIIKTQKVAAPSRIGLLPKDIISFLHSINPKCDFYRKGSMRSVNSVIDAILSVRKKKYNELDNSDKLEYINEIKENITELVEENNITLLQETYNINLLQRLSEDKYFDPHLFHGILQEVLNCNLIIFTRNEMFPDGVLSCPHYSKKYLNFEYNKELPFIFIYENIGTESDNLKYPQCEIIFQVDDDGNNRYLFRYNEFIESIDRCFKTMYPVKTFENIKKLFKQYEIVNYGTDEYGKTVNITLKGRILLKNKIFMITDQLPSLGLNILQDNISFGKINQFTSKDICSEFFRNENINYEANVKNGIMYGYKCVKNNITFYIPTIPENVKGIIKDNPLEFPIMEKHLEISKGISTTIGLSNLEEYTFNKSVSRMIIEYFFYLFSIDYNKYKPEKIDNLYLRDFINRNIVITDIKNIDYKKLILKQRNFKIDHIKVKDNFGFPLPNLNILNKLVYNLKLKLVRDKNGLLTYNQLQYIPSFYQDIDDFKESMENNNIILKGKYSVLQWIKSTKNNYHIYDNIQLPKSSIYDEIDNILDDNEKDNLLMIVFVSKWSKLSRNIQNKLYSQKNRKFLFDNYKKYMTIIYIDIDIHKVFSDYFAIKTLPTFIFSQLDRNTKILNVISRIEGENKSYKTLKILNREVKELFRDQNVEDDLTDILEKVENDDDIEKALEEAFETLDIDETLSELDIKTPTEQLISEETERKEDEEESKYTDEEESEEEDLSSYFSKTFKRKN
jgi:hypothetical protein